MFFCLGIKIFSCNKIIIFEIFSFWLRLWYLYYFYSFNKMFYFFKVRDGIFFEWSVMVYSNFEIKFRFVFYDLVIICFLYEVLIAYCGFYVYMVEYVDFKNLG